MVIYNKGVLALWEMHQLLGEDRMDAAFHEFVAANASHTGKRPGLEDFLAVVRKHSGDLDSFDTFVEEWIDSVH